MTKTNGRIRIDDQEFKNANELLEAGKELRNANLLTPTQIRIMIAAAEHLPERPSEYWHAELNARALKLRSWWTPATTQERPVWPPHRPTEVDAKVAQAEVEMNRLKAEAEAAQDLMFDAKQAMAVMGRFSTFVTNRGIEFNEDRAARQVKREDRRAAAQRIVELEQKYRRAADDYCRANGKLGGLLKLQQERRMELETEAQKA